MPETFTAAAGNRRRPGARFFLRTARQTLVESLYRLRVTSPPGGPATTDAELPCC